MEEIVVLVTTSGEAEGAKIARAVVEARLAACANLLGPVQSTFRWEGKVVEERESLLLIKTCTAKFDALSKEIKRLHSYSVPEIIALPIVRGTPDYLQWVRDMTNPDT